MRFAFNTCIGVETIADDIIGQPVNVVNGDSSMPGRVTRAWLDDQSRLQIELEVEELPDAMRAYTEHTSLAGLARARGHRRG